MINFFAGLFALAFGFGLAFWICGTELDKSNNIGDSRGDGASYKAEATFTSKCDRMEQSAYRTFVQQNIIDNVATNGPAGQEQVRRLTEEERRKKAEAEKSPMSPKVPLSRKTRAPLLTHTTCRIGRNVSEISL